MPLISYTAMSGMGITASRNGLFDRLRHASKQTTGSGRQFAGRLAVPVKICRTMVQFFTSIASFDDYALGLQGLRFISIWMSIWLLINLESTRRGNSRCAVAGFGLLMEFMGVGVALPWWCLVDLWSSDSVFAHTTDALAEPEHMDSMKWSLLVGAGLPTLFMYLSTSRASQLLFSKEFWIVIRLFHPLISYVVFEILHVFPRQTQTSSPGTRASTGKLRQGYDIVYWTCASAHILSIVCAIAIKLANTRSDVDDQEPSLWLVTSPWQHTSHKIKNIQEGVRIFLFWNEVTTCLAIVIWAFAINQMASPSQTAGQTLYVLGKTVISWIAIGPTATAVVLLVARENTPYL